MSSPLLSDTIMFLTAESARAHEAITHPANANRLVSGLDEFGRTYVVLRLSLDCLPKNVVKGFVSGARSDSDIILPSTDHRFSLNFDPLNGKPVFQNRSSRSLWAGRKKLSSYYDTEDELRIGLEGFEFTVHIPDRELFEDLRIPITGIPDIQVGGICQGLPLPLPAQGPPHHAH
ncbi:hypothetical protein D8B26_002420 [Coccidioides posadasii str. Silveira]|uniref:Uncharacterized protein n=1 Tax=Coccidioides posadasii (strain RMSCC 757 / Silveira) TaxID=443226 RepID=E9DHJ1_COCPS|nr:conserved hypothetical protein [Coccidioides posadasii str. Silveira]QVM07729.1 hypothetical protein D8B26_002420 [Coccidioides posadasii str. Silveira]